MTIIISSLLNNVLLLCIYFYFLCVIVIYHGEHKMSVVRTMEDDAMNIVLVVGDNGITVGMKLSGKWV